MTNKIKKLSIAIAMTLGVVNIANANDLKTIGNIALENDYKIEQLHNNFLISVEKNNEVKGMFKPQVNLQAAGNYTLLEEKNGRDYNDTLNGNVGLNFNYALYDSSESALERIQDKKAMVDFYNFESYKQELLYNVSKVYYETLRNRKIVEVDIETKKAMETQYEQINNMVEVGLRTNVDLLEVRAELDQAKANLVASENNLQNSLSQLYLYTGTYDLNPKDVSFLDKKKDLEENGYDYWFKILDENNFNLKKANLAKMIAKDNIKVAESNSDFKVALNGGINSTYNNRYNDEFENSANVGFSITLPVYTSGVNDSITKQSQMSYTNSSIDLDYMYRQLRPQLKIVINQLESMDRGIISLEKTVESTKSSLDAIQGSYDVGVRNIVDLLNANTQYFISLKNLANAEYDYLLKQNELLYLVGTLDIENI